MSATVPSSLIFLVFIRISFKNFVYEGIWVMPSVKGILIWSFFQELNELFELFLNFDFRESLRECNRGFVRRRRHIWFFFVLLNYLIFLRCLFILFLGEYIFLRSVLLLSFTPFLLSAGSSRSFPFHNVITLKYPFGFDWGCHGNIPAGAAVDAYC